jgi:hypothetical protein
MGNDCGNNPRKHRSNRTRYWPGVWRAAVTIETTQMLGRTGLPRRVTFAPATLEARA